MINHELDLQVKNWIEEHRDALLAEWMDLCRIPSVRGDAEEGAPFGRACADALAASAKLYQKWGFDTRLEAESGYAIASYGEGDCTIGLFAHSDVVPVGDDWTVTQPFEPLLKDGALFGRGSGDNKSGIIQSLIVLSVLRDLKIPIKSRIWAVTGSNEESGMEDLHAFAKNEPMPTLSLSPDAAYPCGVGEKSIYRVWAESNGTLEAVTDFRGGEAMNVVLGKAEITLKNSPELKEELLEKIAEKENFTLTEKGDELHLLSIGKSAHAAAARRGISATYLAAELLADCQSLPASDRTILKAAADRLSSPLGIGMGLSHEDPIFGPLTAANGIVRMEEGHLAVGFDFRYGISLNPQLLEEAFEKSWSIADWSVRDGANRSGFHNDPESPIPAIFTEIYNGMTGKDRKPGRLSGGTYCRCLKNAFSIGVSAADPQSTAIAPELPDGHGGAHQPDEYVMVDNIFYASRVLIQCLLKCDDAIN